MTAKLYINTWGRYNKGLEGQWFEIGVDDNEDFKTELKHRIKDYDPEYFIQDYESDFEIDENTNFFELNEALLNVQDEDTFKAVAEWEGLETAIEETENYFEAYRLYHGVFSDEELGLELLDESSIPDHLQGYIDYEAYGRDQAINATSCYTLIGYIERY